MMHILTVEDEVIIRTALKRLLEKNGYRVSEAGSVDEALSSYTLADFDLIISDLRLPGAPGTDMITASGDTPVLIMTSYASLRSAVDSMKMGAVDYIAKPFDHDEMLSTVQRITELSRNSKALEADLIDEEALELPKIIGQSPPMKKVYSHVKKSAPTDCNIYIQGETGTGKELIANAIHQLSLRTNKPLVCVNCAAIPETLIESELFGYEKGAFTGANTNRSGLIEAADNGTLFLDEIGELPLEAQARLLRFLQEGEIRRIGSVVPLKVNVRVIVATHRDLKRLSAEGKFRQDLYYRLNVMQIQLPPLRERGKDIVELAQAFLVNSCERLKKPAAHFSAKAMQAIATYNWPGNIRELENVVERAVILSESTEIDDDLLDIDLELVQINNLNDEMDSGFAEAAANNFQGSDTAGLSLEDYFQRFILEHQDQMSETDLARKLGVSRKSLWERRQRLGIPRKKTQG